MKLTFCAACGSTDDLQHNHLVTRGEDDSDDARNLITLCYPCHLKLHKRVKAGQAAAKARGVKIGRKLMTEAHPEAIAMARKLASVRKRKPSLRAISAALAESGHLNERGAPFNPASVAKMLTR